MQSQSTIVTVTLLAYILGTTFTTLQLTITSYGQTTVKKLMTNKIISTTRLSYKSFDNFNNHIEKNNLSYCMLV